MKNNIENPGQLNTKPEENSNRFNLDNLRLSQDFETIAGVKRLITSIPVRKPNRQEFARVHPDDSFHIETAVIELKEDRETFLIAPELWSELPGEITPKLLLTCLNRQGVLFLWPIRLPNSEGRLDNWNRSAMEAAEHAKNDWVRVVANMSLGAYDVYQATGDIPEPEWPDLDFNNILEIAFKDQFISSMDHPAIRKLRGAI